MRVKVSIDDSLLVEVKAMAARSQRTLRSVVEDGLREQLRLADASSGQSFDLPVDGDPQGRPLVDLYHRDALVEALSTDSA